MRHSQYMFKSQQQKREEQAADRRMVVVAERLANENGVTDSLLYQTPVSFNGLSSARARCKSKQTERFCQAMMDSVKGAVSSEDIKSFAARMDFDYPFYGGDAVRTLRVGDDLYLYMVNVSSTEVVAESPTLLGRDCTYTLMVRHGNDTAAWLIGEWNIVLIENSEEERKG